MYKANYKAAIFAASLMAFFAPAHAQTPTPQQLQMFKNLPLEQQQQLAAKYGITLPNGANASNQSNYETTGPVPTRDPSLAREQERNKQPELDEKGNKVLPRFGLSLFAGSPSTFAPVGDVPVPSSYTVGAGDEIIVQLFGQLNETHRLRVNRAGIINFPSIGPLPVAGMKFSDVRRTLAMRVEEQLIGVRSDVTLGELRTMQIFVAGDAYKPGAYTVSALTTMSQAIYFSGGFSEQGALRNVQLKRDGKVIAKLDLYDLLLKGDSSDDLRLLPGDVVHIAPVGSTIAIDGEINRPAVYEILPGESYQTVIALAGGLNSQADNRKIEVKRYLPNGGKEVITLDLTKASDQRLSAKSGDAVTVLKKSAELTNYVKLEGDIVQAGFRQWRPKQRIADLFSDINSSFNSSADVNYALLVREINHQRDIEVHQIDIAAAILAPNGKENKELRPRDKIIVFNRFDPRELDQVLTHKATLQSSDDEASMAKSYETAIEQAARDKQEKQQQNQTSVVQVLEQSTQSGIVNRQQNSGVNGQFKEQGYGQSQLQPQQEEKLLYRGIEVTRKDIEKLRLNTRQALLAPILLKLQEQSKAGTAPLITEVVGEVKYPGRYPISVGMTVSGLVKAAGGLTFDAYTINAELAHSVMSKRDERVRTAITRVDLRRALNNDAQSDIQIAGRDRLNILEKPAAKLQNTVILQGEVHFPGTYTVRRGETMQELIQRAGGLTSFANPEGAIFTREALRLQEKKLLEQYAADIRKETAKKTFRVDSNISSMISDPDKTLRFIEEVSSSQALGRMVIQLGRILQGGRGADFVLEDGDFLYVPTFRNTVSVMGEVQVPITYLLEDKLDADDYLEKAGGMKKQADKDRIFVVRANGSVYKPKTGYWFGRNKQKLQAGDTIVVPIDTDYRDGLSTWSAATQIMYQVGVAINALRP